ncbi:mannose-1-phosphate guanylyltransferase/mannose-6-phosphate isomerase [Nevskia soli]|uniref:mannose-1-phosphate guanylyltransferase/mannose-6-phosphate isomerase n=1 Tax=Nevskia soli TaxID=418856 RepID=UPI0004A6ABBB|nr:mannose-1-phosphate guanylyltransferase/mannose-6-phosphate isomerase [Nevskia soli]
MIVPVLLAGGSGTRLWPLSREGYPKQFLKLTDEWSLLQHTVRRAGALAGATPPILICNEAHRFLVAEQLRQAGVEGAEILLEPEARNTAPAVAIACLVAKERHGGDALVFIMAADHLIADLSSFVASTEIAAKVAAHGRLTTFGITPQRVETGYGYIRKGAALPEGGFEVAAFVEKPDSARAKAYVDSGEYLWNSGMFLFKAQSFLDELQHLDPAMLEACSKSVADAKRDLDFVRLDAAAFKAARSDSIDYAVMEKTDKAAIVPLDAGWDDVGSWSFLETRARDSRGNYSHGDVMLEDSDNTLIHSESRLVAALGLKDVVVVETKDAVLVTDRSRAQDVKRIVSRLKSLRRPEAESHTVVHRPWGSYETIATGSRFQVKRIIVKPRQKLSLQMHHHRAEHWIVVCGTARVTCGDKEFLLAENESTYIPLGSQHRLENPGSILLELIEVQSGGYLGEDDIVRFNDVYGRAS